MKPFLIFVIALGLVACGTDGTSVLTGQSRPSTDPSQVVLYLTPPAKYETIGLVSAKSGRHGSDQSKMEDAVQKLKEEAADVGANGVVIQGTGEATSGSTGVIIQAGNVPMIFSAQNHRETINGIAIFVPTSGADDSADSLTNVDFKSVSAKAEEGDPSSQCKLGLLYQAGTGTPQDYVQALEWFILAKADADTKSEVYKNASADMEKLESQMTPTQIADAQKSASEWFASHSQK